MADKKPRYEAFTTPAGTAVFPWLTKADTRYDPAGKFHTKLSVPFDEAQAFIAKLDRTLDDFIQTLPVGKQKALTRKPVYEEEYTWPTFPEEATDEERQAIKDAWVGEPTGNVLFKANMKAHVDTDDGGFDQKPVVVMADTGEAVTVPVFGGSIIRMRGQIVPYVNAAAGAVGITLRLKAVQVLELQTGDGDGGSFWTNFDEDDA